MTRPFTVWLLLALLWFLGFGGLYGGVLMLMDPSGHLIQMHSVLHLLLVPDFFLPGLFLFFVMGLSPLGLSYALLQRPNWHWLAQRLPLQTYHWAWTGTLLLGLLLCGWLAVQGLLMGFKWPIQYITTANALLILAVLAFPDIRSYYTLK